MLASAGRFAADEGLSNVGLQKDDLFASKLSRTRSTSCTPDMRSAAGRGQEQMETYTWSCSSPAARSCSKTFAPAPDTTASSAVERLIVPIQEAFRQRGGALGSGRRHLHLLGEFGITGIVSAEAPGPSTRVDPTWPHAPSSSSPRSMDDREASSLSRRRARPTSYRRRVRPSGPGRWGTTHQRGGRGPVRLRPGLLLTSTSPSRVSLPGLTSALVRRGWTRQPARYPTTEEPEEVVYLEDRYAGALLGLRPAVGPCYYESGRRTSHSRSKPTRSMVLTSLCSPRYAHLQVPLPKGGL